MADFGCKEENCTGQVITEASNAIGVRTGCIGSCPAFPCSTCGRLYWENGNPVSNRSEEPAFCIDGKIGTKGANGEITFY